MFLSPLTLFLQSFSSFALSRASDTFVSFSLRLRFTPVACKISSKTLSSAASTAFYRSRPLRRKSTILASQSPFSSSSLAAAKASLRTSLFEPKSEKRPALCRIYGATLESLLRLAFSHSSAHRIKSLLPSHVIRLSSTKTFSLGSASLVLASIIQASLSPFKVHSPVNFLLFPALTSSRIYLLSLSFSA